MGRFATLGEIMRRFFRPLFVLFFLTSVSAIAQWGNISSKTLPNGLKVIFCEKPGSGFVHTEVWYKVGSKDETDGIRGMAHLFEHMMFRGTAKYPGNSYFRLLDSAGAASLNAYTTFDRTVYHSTVPSPALELVFDLESDRMKNFIVTQEILNTEREVVGEEFRNGENNWYQKLHYNRYPYLYPKGHPYAVDVIGFLPEILSFRAEQCVDFFKKHYHPGNAFVVVTGDVKPEIVFSLAEKYFGTLTAVEIPKTSLATPPLTLNPAEKTDFGIGFPVQIYSLIIPRPAVNHPDFFTFNFLVQYLFTNENGILNERLVKKEKSAFAIQSMSEDYSLFPNLGIIDIIMEAGPGNVRVKKAIKEELQKIAEEGISQKDFDLFVENMERNRTFSLFSLSDLASELGMMEFYFGDFEKVKNPYAQYRKITAEDIRRVSKNWLGEDKFWYLNCKPEWNE